MSQFIELHLLGSNNQQPLMLNTDCIAYVKPYETGRKNDVRWHPVYG